MKEEDDTGGYWRLRILHIVKGGLYYAEQQRSNFRIQRYSYRNTLVQLGLIVKKKGEAK